MATSRTRGMQGTTGLLNYCLDTQGKNNRVQFVHSTFISGTDKDGIASELKLFAGKKYDGLATRISFDPHDRKLSGQEFKNFCEIISKDYLKDRNYIAICHNDTEHQHIHIISTFLDADNKPLNFVGRAKYKEAIRQQETIDKACRELNLSTLQRPEGRFNTRDGIEGYSYKNERIVKAEKQGKQPEKAELRKLINNAKSISELEPYITRETENSLTFSFKGKKIRLNSINMSLKNRADLETYISNRIQHNQGNADRLRRAEQMFLNRLTKTMEALKYQGMAKQEIQNRINAVLSHRAKNDAPSARWESLKNMKSELDRVMTREQLQTIKQQMYRQQLIKRHQSKMLKKALRAGNPIAAFALGITYIINAIATRHGDINRDGITEDYITELLKTKQTLKQPTPEPNRMAPGN